MGFVLPRVSTDLQTAPPADPAGATIRLTQGKFCYL